MASPFPENPLPGEDSRAYRIGVMLINGYGYNWYRQENRMRADDLLVRERASGILAGAMSHLRELEGRYRRKFLPPPTREHPDHDPECLAAARNFRAIEERVGEIDTRVRGASVPPNDRVWQRHRDQVETLRRLGECDVLLVGGAKELAEGIVTLPVDAAIDPAAAEQMGAQLAQLASILTRRADILAAF